MKGLGVVCSSKGKGLEELVAATGLGELCSVLQDLELDLISTLLLDNVRN
jgi:hypothetical protein